MGIFSVIILIIIVLFIYGWQNVWKVGFGSADKGAIEFATFIPSKKPNNSLACPRNYCKNAPKSKLSPIYDMDIDTLKAKLFTIVETNKSIETVATNDKTYEYRFVEYSKIMRFPDTIRVKLIKLNDKKSTLAIHSESQIGHSDLGVNAKRVNDWLRKIGE